LVVLAIFKTEAQPILLVNSPMQTPEAAKSNGGNSNLLCPATVLLTCPSAATAAFLSLIRATGRNNRVI
jgi:hypothetical protein